MITYFRIYTLDDTVSGYPKSEYNSVAICNPSMTLKSFDTHGYLNRFDSEKDAEDFLITHSHKGDFIILKHTLLTQ